MLFFSQELPLANIRLRMPASVRSRENSSRPAQKKESDEIIANPERGFYSARSSGYPLTASDITSNRVNNITLFYIGYQIPADAKIPDVPGHTASGEDISFGTHFNPWK